MPTETRALVFSRAGCHLCELFVEALLPLVRGKVAIEVVDVDTSAALVEEYGTRVPVLENRWAVRLRVLPGP